jgi:anti-sigma-K factor RskA
MSAGEQMKDKHILEVIDSAALASLTPVELDEVKAHARDCASCGTAFEAAQLSALVIRQRAQVKIEPSPFFHTKVLAAWREQQAAESVPAFVRLWKSASAVVSTMALATVALAVMTFVYPDPATAVTEQQVASADAAEAVLFDQGDDQLTYEQVLSTIYDEGDEAR